jgi:site-specific DNA-methyltransferase (adenine-specific)
MSVNQPPTMEINKIYNEDCRIGFNRVASGSMAAIICDLPFGTTNNKWDVIIEMNDHIKIKKKVFNKDDFFLYCYKKGRPIESANKIWKRYSKKGLWHHYNRVLKDDGVVLLFSQQPFTTYLINSNPKDFRYEIIWEKTQAQGFLNASKMPLRAHENILVFYKKLPTYNPIKTKGHKKESKKESKAKCKPSTTYGKVIHLKDYCSTERFPRTVLKFATDKQKEHYHPTQKPRALLKYIILTFTNEGDLVGDNCMGSGTTAVECQANNRNFIGFDNGIDEDTKRPWAEIATERVIKASGRVGLFE